MAEADKPSTVTLTLTVSDSPTTETLTLASPMPIGIVVLVTFLATIGGQTLIAILSWMIWRKRLLFRRVRAASLDVEAKALPPPPTEAPSSLGQPGRLPQPVSSPISRSSRNRTPSLIGSSAMAVVGVDGPETPRSASTITARHPGHDGSPTSAEPSLSALDRKDSRLLALELAIEEAAKQANISDVTLARLIVAMQQTLLTPDEHEGHVTHENDPFVDQRHARRSTASSGGVSLEQPPSYKTAPVQKRAQRGVNGREDVLI